MGAIDGLISGLNTTQIISQLPPILESLTGVKFETLLEQVPALKKALPNESEPKG